MIQQFKNSFSYFWKLSDKYIILILILVLYILTKLFAYFPLKRIEEVNQLLNNIIQFSAIFSAILITFIVSKVIQIRQERIERLKRIVELSNKVTDFRRIASILKNSYNFWNATMKGKLDNKYKELNYFSIMLWDYDNEENNKELKELRESYFKETDICGASLYLSVKSFILDDIYYWQEELYDNYDHNYTYSLEILEKWTDANCANVFWTCLDYKWNEYQGCFNLGAIIEDDRTKILKLCKKINPKEYSASQFDRFLIGKIGSELDGYILPMLRKLTYYNNLGLSEALNFMLTILFLTITSGVLMPLLLSSVKFEAKVVLKLSTFSATILIMSLVYFLFKFKEILKAEIKIN